MATAEPDTEESTGDGGAPPPLVPPGAVHAAETTPLAAEP